MKLFNKRKQSSNGCKTTDIFIGGFSIWSEKKTFLWRNLKLLGITILSYKNKHSLYKNEQVFENINDFSNFVQDTLRLSSKGLILWVDHSLGGGTETYSFNQFLELENKYIILRLQYNPGFDCYVISVPKIAVSYSIAFDKIKSLLSKFNFNEICVNNIVGWSKALELLSFVDSYKKNNYRTKISFRGHDFHSICPSFNLLNYDKVFCNLSHKKGCEYCIKNMKLDDDDRINKILFSGFEDINKWKNSWNDFFSKTLDEIIVFSNSTKELFIKAYPSLEKKIIIIPHKIKDLPIVAPSIHTNINIAMLGNMNSIAKGRNIIKEMCKLNTDIDIKLFVIGTYKNAPKTLTVSGKYKTQDITRFIKKYNIDIIFIPSIWPETFSYTTAEAMSMNLPVACYAIGAPAERVSKYEKGLILKDINPVENLREIKKFVKHLRKETN